MYVFVCKICSSGVWLVIGGKVGSGRRGALSSSGRMKGLYQQAVPRPGSAATGRGGADHRQVGGQWLGLIGQSTGKKGLGLVSIVRGWCIEVGWAWCIEVYWSRGWCIDCYMSGRVPSNCVTKLTCLNIPLHVKQWPITYIQIDWPYWRQLEAFVLKNIIF